MHPTTIVAGAVALALTNSAEAQQTPNDKPTLLERLVVSTPLRRETPLVRSTSSVTVIDGDAIEKSAAPDLPSLLKSYTGVSIASYGGQGATANVYLRGMSATQTLVLINGVRAGTATSGTTSLFNIPLGSIERIEIAKGAHSAQYGADAMGGVINIITRQGGACADGRNACASLTTGVAHPWGGYVAGDVQGQTEGGVNYALGGRIIGTRGYDFTTPLAWGHEPDDDGFLQGSANFALSKDFDWGRLYADGLFARGRGQYDGAFPDANEVDTDTLAGKAGARVDHSDSWASTVELMTALDHSTNFRNGVPGGDQFDTRRNGIFVSTEKTFETDKATHVLTGGGEAYRENVDSNVDFDVTSRDLAAVFGQYSLEYDALIIDSGIRFDHNEQFGGATTYNVGASYEVLPDLVVRASYATGFRAPTFNELYYPLYSNPDLKPEKSRSYEIGFNWQPNTDTSLNVAAYQTLLSDAIASNPPTYLPFNVARARISGVEAILAHRFDERWAGKAAIDVLSAKDEDNGRYIPYRDRFKATAEVSYAATDKLDLTTRLLYGAARYANAANTIKLPDYVTIDFSAIYTLDDQSTLKLSVENLFDAQYSTLADYRAPGRTINVSFARVF